MADADADHDLVDFRVEEAITDTVAGREDAFIAWVVAFAHDYARRVRADHALFVDAFREDQIPGVSSS